MNNKPLFAEIFLSQILSKNLVTIWLKISENFGFNVFNVMTVERQAKPINPFSSLKGEGIIKVAHYCFTLPEGRRDIITWHGME